MSKSKRDFTLSHTNYYFLQRTQPLEQHKPPAVNYILRDPQYFLHYFEDDERSAPPSALSAFGVPGRQRPSLGALQRQHKPA